MITDSHRTSDRTCRRVMPTARMSPSSRVRSMIERPSVFAMPNTAMSTAKSSSAVTKVEEALDLRRLRRLELRPVLQLADRVLLHRLLERGPVLPASAHPSVWMYTERSKTFG